MCPTRDRHALSSTTPGAATALVPPGARTALLCRYSGLGDVPRSARSLALIAQHLLDSSDPTGELATKFNSLPVVTGTFHCPADGGATIIAFFRYGTAAAADDPVTVHLGGCSTVTNGWLTRVAGTTSSGRALLDALTFQTRAAAYEVRPYQLLTHCGITWARIRGTFWKADRPLSDGHGNPPAGWGNPYQAGTLRFTSVRTAIFTSPAGSVTFHRTTRTRPAVICS
ncbi:MAG: hypothetical protein ACXVFQ_18365 [Solirubrobacteraceae bacterium]